LLYPEENLNLVKHYKLHFMCLSVTLHNLATKLFKQENKMLGKMGTSDEV